MRYACKALCIGVPSALQLDSIFGHYSYEWNAEARCPKCHKGNVTWSLIIPLFSDAVSD